MVEEAVVVVVVVDVEVMAFGFAEKELDPLVCELRRRGWRGETLGRGEELGLQMARNEGIAILGLMLRRFVGGCYNELRFGNLSFVEVTCLCSWNQGKILSFL